MLQVLGKKPKQLRLLKSLRTYSSFTLPTYILIKPLVKHTIIIELAEEVVKISNKIKKKTVCKLMGLKGSPQVKRKKKISIEGYVGFSS